jgi:transposase-like protein
LKFTAFPACWSFAELDNPSAQTLLFAMDASISGQARVGVHTTGELAELSHGARFTLSGVHEFIESDALKTNGKMYPLSQHMAQEKLRQSNPEDLHYTLADLNREFPTDDSCLEYIKEQRWPNGVTQCQKCNVPRKHSRVTGRAAYACAHCGNHIYPLKGTVFARSTTSLKTWLYVIYLIASTGRCITAKRIQRETGVTYKTAWRTLRHLRQLIVKE